MSNIIHLRHGDCVEVLAAMEAGTVGGVVSDPPYGLEFMGKDFDILHPVWRTFEELPAAWVAEYLEERGGR